MKLQATPVHGHAVLLTGSNTELIKLIDALELSAAMLRERGRAASYAALLEQLRADLCEQTGLVRA